MASPEISNTSPTSPPPEAKVIVVAPNVRESDAKSNSLSALNNRFIDDFLGALVPSIPCSLTVPVDVALVALLLPILTVCVVSPPVEKFDDTVKLVPTVSLSPTESLVIIRFLPFVVYV